MLAEEALYPLSGRSTLDVYLGPLSMIASIQWAWRAVGDRDAYSSFEVPLTDS